MNEPLDRPPEADDPTPLDDLEHPRGTLFVVFLYGILFALGWVALYVFEFLPRGMPQG